jgi:hypothetical protein
MTGVGAPHSFSRSQSPLQFLEKAGPRLDEARLQGFRDALPPLHRAMALRQIYFDQVSWRCNPIDMDELDSDVLRPLYGLSGATVYTIPPPLHVRAYRLATMFAIFAIAETFESNTLSQPLTLDYYQLTSDLLMQSPVLEEPTVEVVQVLVTVLEFNAPY